MCVKLDIEPAGGRYPRKKEKCILQPALNSTSRNEEGISTLALHRHTGTSISPLALHRNTSHHRIRWTACRMTPPREIQTEISPPRRHQPSTETSTAGERELAQLSRSVASHCSRKACRSKAKLRRMVLRTGQKQWILGCSLRGHQSRNTTHRNSTCSEQATAIKGPTPVVDKNLVGSSRSTRRQDRTRQKW